MKKLITNSILFSPAIIAVILWLLLTYDQSNFSSTPTTLKTIGQLAGLIGATLFAWNFILASRLRVIEEFFFGLNKVYTSHHLVGAIAFMFLLYHPIFLSLEYLPFGIKAISQFVLPPLQDYPVWFGILGLDIIIISLFITFFVKTKYHLWKLSHQILGVSLGLASLHIIFVPNILVDNLPLRMWIYLIFGTATITFTTRTLLGKYFVKRYEYTVEKIEERGSGVREIYLKPQHDKMNYRPGQFMFIKIYGQGIKKEFHPFTITSPGNSELLSFSPKELGDFTKQLSNLQVNDKATIEGPYGKFQLDIYHNTNQIWIAGGIGITPYLGWLRSLQPDHPYNIHFYYSAKNPSEAVYIPEIKSHLEKLPNIMLIPFFQETDGFLTMQAIATKTPDFLKRDMFLCGPPSMMKALKAQAKPLGVPEPQIHSEEFALYEGK